MRYKRINALYDSIWPPQCGIANCLLDKRGGWKFIFVKFLLFLIVGNRDFFFSFKSYNDEIRYNDKVNRIWQDKIIIFER